MSFFYVLDVALSFRIEPCKCHSASQVSNKTYVHFPSLSIAILTTLLNKLKLISNLEKQ